MPPLDVALDCGRPARIKMWRALAARSACSNSSDRNSEALSVVTASSLHPLAARSWATRRASELVQRAEGFLGLRCSSAHMNPDETSMAVYCQQVPLAPTAVRSKSSPAAPAHRMVDVDVALGLGVEPVTA